MLSIARRTLIVAAGVLAARPLLTGAVAAEIDPTAKPGFPFTLPPLPYEPNANEPAIDALTMQIHHDKHHGAYVKNLNDALKDYPDLQAFTLAQLIQRLGEVPETVRAAVRNNAGGHANHTMFWQILGGNGGEPDGALKSAIDRDFGSFDKLKADLNSAAMKVFGSGWAMVLVDKDGKLSLVSRPNQDSPWMDGKAPLFGNDVWEHAYYLKYQNRRADYVQAFWTVLNWPAIAARYDAAKQGTLGI